MTIAPTELRNGVNIALARVRYRLTVRHRTGEALVAVSENYDALNDQLRQLVGLGYELVGIVPINATELAA